MKSICIYHSWYITWGKLGHLCLIKTNIHSKQTQKNTWREVSVFNGCREVPNTFLIHTLFHSFPMSNPPNTNLQIEELISLKKYISCADNRLTLPHTEATPKVFNLSLIGKVISPTKFSLLVVRDIILQAWNLSQGVSV